MSRFLPRPEDHVEAYRFLAIAASLATCAVIVWTVRKVWPERTAFALVAFGANPVVLFHSVASGHNDILVALAIACAFALVVSDHEMAAVAVLTLGALVKATALLPLAMLLIWCIARRPPGRRRSAALSHVGLVAGICLVFALPYMQMHDPTLGMLELAGHEGWLSPAAVIGRALDRVSFHTLGWAARVATALVLVGCSWVLGREVWRRTPGGSMSSREQAAVWGWALVLLMLLGPVLLPWYVVWALPLAWVLPRPARTALIATGALLGVTLWSALALRYPGGFALNVAIGDWVVVPVLLWLLVAVIRDLRSRVRAGLPFEDQAATTSSLQPHGEERVADAAGQRAGAGGDRPPLEIGAEAL